MKNLIAFIYVKFMKPALFARDPEKVHDHFIQIGNRLGKNSIFKTLTKWTFKYNHKSLNQQIHGITFKNPIGLSAGFDKNADTQNIMSDVGFGFMQLGSVTWHSYAGNLKPRLHRLPKSRALIVNYGLKNIGARKIAEKLKSFKNNQFPIGISIAKTNSRETCSVDIGVDDYFQSYKLFNEQNIGSFYTLNISCPNVHGGTPFTEPINLDLLLTKIRTINSAKPVFVKLPINLSWTKLDELLKIILAHEIEGVIIGNLNKDRSLVKETISDDIKGGISGKPTCKLSNYLIEKIYKKYGNKLTIIGVGGIFTAKDAYKKIKLGSSLVQLITGMIYGGPQTIGEINKGLVKLLQKDGFKNISEAIGSSVKK